VSSLRRGHANLLCIVPILTDDPRRESKQRTTKDCRQDRQNNQNTAAHNRELCQKSWNGLRSLVAIVTVAILAQGTSWAVAVTQAFLLPGSILVARAMKDCRQDRQNNQNTAAHNRELCQKSWNGLRSLVAIVTVAILAQGTSWAVAVTQAFLLPGSILVARAMHLALWIHPNALILQAGR
jgi:hypothetical protein